MSITATHRGLYFIPTPEKCDICGDKFSNTTGTLMYDAGVRRQRGSPWACMCGSCFTFKNGELGIGLGQEYVRREDGKFWQTKGGSYGTS